MKTVDEKEIQNLCTWLIDEIEVAGGIGIYFFCEKLAHHIFATDHTPHIEKRWLQGCISPAALEYFRNHDISNWVDDD